MSSNAIRVINSCLLVVASITASYAQESVELEVGETRTPLVLEAGNMPEGVAVFGDAVFLGNRHASQLADGTPVLSSEILRVTPDATDLFATFPDSLATRAALLGLAIDSEGVVFAALDSGEDATRGVWRVEGGQEPVRLAGSENMVFPNALTFDAAGNLYATDSELGQIWKFAGDSAPTQPWADSDLLRPLEEDPFGDPVPGANGIAFYEDQLYVANTEKGLLVRFPINENGTAGAAELVAGGDPRLISLDGIAADINGDIHGVIPGYTIAPSFFPDVEFAPLIKIDTETGAISSLIFDDPDNPQFDVPLSLAFGQTGPDRFTVYVANGDLPLNDLGPGPRLLQVGVGVEGYQVVPEPVFASALCAVACCAAGSKRRRRRAGGIRGASRSTGASRVGARR